MRALVLAVAVLCGGVAWAAEPDRNDVERAEARRMVKQLGSRDGMERLAAERRLLELGPVAVDAVKDGRTSDATQVADRCARLIDACDDVVTRLSELFKADPAELKKLVEQKLPKEAATALMKQVQ